MVRQMLVKVSREFATLIGHELCHNAVIGFTGERLDFLLTLSNEPYCHALHPACRKSRHDFTPEHGRQFKAHDTVKYATSLLSIHQIQVNAARVLYRLEDSGLSNLVEDNAPGIFRRQSQDLIEVPRDGFSLTVFITCKPHNISLLGLTLEFLNLFFLIFRNFIEGLETIFHVNAEILLM